MGKAYRVLCHNCRTPVAEIVAENPTAPLAQIRELGKITIAGGQRWDSAANGRAGCVRCGAGIRTQKTEEGVTFWPRCIEEVKQ